VGQGAVAVPLSTHATQSLRLSDVPHNTAASLVPNQWQGKLHQAGATVAVRSTNILTVSEHMHVAEVCPLLTKSG